MRISIEGYRIDPGHVHKVRGHSKQDTWLGKGVWQGRIDLQSPLLIMSDWNSKVTTIEESHNLSKMLLENLIWNLTIHERRLNEGKKHQKHGIKEDPIAQKAKKGKAIIKSSSSSKDEQDDVETYLLVKGFKTFEFKEC